MNHAMRKRLNRMLGEHGLGQLDHPGLVPQLAYFVRDHDHLRSLLVACEPAERRNMYEALAPNLRFKARTLDQYLTEAKQDAEARQLPIQAEDGTLKPFQVAEIAGGERKEHGVQGDPGTSLAICGHETLPSDDPPAYKQE